MNTIIYTYVLYMYNMYNVIVHPCMYINFVASVSGLHCIYIVPVTASVTCNCAEAGNVLAWPHNYAQNKTAQWGRPGTEASRVSHR